MRDWLRYAWKRINWRVGFALMAWLAAPRIGLDAATVLTVRDAAAGVVVLAFLSWANRNGRRATPRAPTRDAGIVGSRPPEEK